MHSPTYVAHYGLPSTNSKRSLIDQIITNCKNIESKKNNSSREQSRQHYRLIQNSSGCASTEQLNKNISSRASKIFQQAQSRAAKLTLNPLERLSMEKRRISKDKLEKVLNNSNSNKHLHDSSASRNKIEKRGGPYNSGIKFNKGHFNQKNHVPCRQNKQNTSEIYEDYFPTNCQRIPLKNHYYPESKQDKGNFQSTHRRKLSIHALKENEQIQHPNQKVSKMQAKINSERDQHIAHCRQEERKLRLYYIQLENQLCEMRNRELKQLEQYQKQRTDKLNELGQKFQEGNKDSVSVEESEEELKKIMNDKTLFVNHHEAKLPLVGCLITGLNGMLFSFDQNL